MSVELEVVRSAIRNMSAQEIVGVYESRGLTVSPSVLAECGHGDMNPNGPITGCCALGAEFLSRFPPGMPEREQVAGCYTLFSRITHCADPSARYLSMGFDHAARGRACEPPRPRAKIEEAQAAYRKGYEVFKLAPKPSAQV